MMSLPEIISYAHLSAVAVVTWSVLCRSRLMDAETHARTLWQHRVLLAAAIASLCVPQALQAVCLVAGMAIFLALSAPRWRTQAPPDTRPAPLGDH